MHSHRIWRDHAHRVVLVDTSPGAVFAELGRWRWLRVSLGGLALAGVVWAIGVLASVGGAQ